MSTRDGSPRLLEAAILGAGPAGTGPLLYATQRGLLEELAGRGVALVERGESLVSGRIPNYRVSSNSRGDAFLDILDGPYSKATLADAARSEARRALESYRDSVAPLRIVGDFLTEVGRALHRELERRDGIELRLSTEVRRVRSARNRFEIELEGGESLRARKVVLALGGEQTASAALGHGIARHLEVEGRRRPPSVLTTDQLLTERGPELAAQALAWSPEPRAVIVGGSHSAYSAAWVLMNRLGGTRLVAGAITMLQRKEPSLYYDHAEAARLDGYAAFDERDVCPLTRRVFRLGGLRGDAKELHRRLVGLGDAEPERRLALRRLPKGGPEAERAAVLEAARGTELLVPALGYRPRLPEILDAEGRRLNLQRSEGGTPLVDRHCRVRTQEGRVVPGLFAMGLGSGFRPDGDLGGEASYRGQTNWLWLYQNGIGEIVLRHLLAEAREGTPVPE